MGIDNILQEQGGLNSIQEQQQRERQRRGRIDTMVGHVPETSPQASIAPTLQFRQSDMLWLFNLGQLILLFLIWREVR